jgi:TrpR-related protein YerC/YecD
MVMNDKLNQENELYYALSLCTNEDEVRAFLKDLCTPGELSALSERLQIAKILSNENKSYREISAITGASTTTVGRVARFLNQEKHQGYTLILNRIQENS